METKIIDLHGTKLKELPKVLDTIMHEAILEERTELEFITGVGDLQIILKKRLEKLYTCTTSYKLGNDGVLLVTL